MKKKLYLTMVTCLAYRVDRELGKVMPSDETESGKSGLKNHGLSGGRGGP